MKFNTRPIQNDDDYVEALAAMHKLWGAPAGSADADLLDVLAGLVDAYENKRYQIIDPEIDKVEFDDCE